MRISTDRPNVCRFARDEGRLFRKFNQKVDLVTEVRVEPRAQVTVPVFFSIVRAASFRFPLLALTTTKASIMFQAKVLSITLLSFVVGLLPTASAVDDVLKIVPADVHAAIVLRSPDESQAALTKLSGQLALPIPDLVALARVRSGLGESIDSSGNVALILDDGIQGDRSPWSAVWCVSTADYAQFLASIGGQKSDGGIATAKVNNRTVLVAQKGGFALLAGEKHRAALQNVLDAESTLADSVSPLESRLSSPDLYVIVTQDGIRFARQALLQGIDMLKQQIARQAPGNENAVAGLAVYEKLLNRIDQDFASAMFGLELADDGSVKFTKSGVYSADGDWKKFSADVPAISGKLLATLPDGPFVFAAAGVLPKQLGEYMMSWSMEAMKIYLPGTDLSDGDIRELVAVGQQIMVGVDGMSMTFGAAADGEPVYAETGFVLQVQDSAAFLQSYAKTIERMNEVMTRTKNPAFTYKVTRREFDGHRGLAIEADMSGFLQSQAIPQTEQAMEAMFGEGGKLNIFMAAAGEHAVVGQYISEERLQARIKRTEAAGSADVDSPITLTLRMLPDHAQGYGFWSLSGTFQMVQSIASATSGVVLPIPEIPSSLPAGFAVSMSEERIDVDAVLPRELLTTITNYAKMISTLQATQ